MENNFNHSDFGSPTRRRILSLVAIAIGLFFIGRLIQLQVLEGSEYRSKSETQAIKQLVIEPVRGAMMDRNGLLIVRNSPSFSVTITPGEFRPEELPYLASLLQIKEEDLGKQIERYRKMNAFIPVKIYRDADISIIAAIEENRMLLPGVDIVSESKRAYEFLGNAAHLLGYTKEINEKQLEALGDYYRPGDVIGANGLEATYENFLRGTKGTEFAGVNAMGQKVARFNNGQNNINAEDGSDLHLGVDIRLQDSIESWMGNYRGGVVVMDPRNGEIISMVSKPDYDLRKFSGRTPAKLYAELLDDEAKPLFNRATSTIYPPGSTWKMVIATAALNEGIIDSNWSINCNGHFTFGNRTWDCHAGHAHGTVNVHKAIHVSCNVFFYQLCLKIGLENFTKYGLMYGFGQKTGADINEEGKGILASEEYFNRVYGPKGWNQGRLVNIAIGQGEVGVTPLQMAAYVSSIANKGTWYQPHTVREIYNRKTGETRPVEYGSRKLPVNPKVFDLLHAAMYDVVNTPGGTASAARIGTIKVCGKTGTAQNPHGEDHAWFVCFAPMENPQIAMCVMIENAGAGGAFSAPIAKKIIEQYFHVGEKSPPQNKDSTQKTLPVASTVR